MNGNVSREGITKDLEYMKSIGVGGLQIVLVHILQQDVSPERVLKFIDLCKKQGNYN
jgi:hypothetical protein